MMTRTIGLITMLLAAVAHAKIGETPEECSKRYDASPPLMRVLGNQFGRNSVSAQCRFRQGKCVSVMYNLAAPGVVVQWPEGKPRRFTKEQSMKLLNLNAPGAKWVLVKPQKYGADFDGVYQTEDGKFQAKISDLGVNVETVEYYRTVCKESEPASVDATLDEICK